MPVNDPKLEVIRLFRQRLVCIVAPTHRLAARKRIEIEEIGKERLILLEKGSSMREQICDAIGAGSIPKEPAMELSNFEIIKRYVAVGLGVAIVPEAAVEPRRDSLCVLNLKKSMTLDSGIVYRGDRTLSHTTSAFLEMAREFFRASSVKAPTTGLSRGPSRS